MVQIVKISNSNSIVFVGFFLEGRGGEIFPKILCNTYTCTNFQYVTFHRKTYTNGFLFSNGIQFTICLEVVRKEMDPFKEPGSSVQK